MSTDAKAKLAVPESLDEEYYQINPDILQSFSKYRPPLNIFRFKEEVQRLLPYYTVGQRLTNEQVEELAQLTSDGYAFVSRSDHAVYVKHISHQLDLVLVDKNLKESEIADIFVEAITHRLDAFFEQPVKAVAERLLEDLFVLTEYLWQDPFRIKSIAKRLHGEHTLPNHSFNSGIMGLSLYVKLFAEGLRTRQIKRKTFDHVAVGLFLHDMGMSKIPIFIRNKDKPLAAEDRIKILQHTNVGCDMLNKLDLKFPEIEQCVQYHHERINGSGYPQKLKDREIPLLGRLCGLVDSYCAMVTKRPYSDAMDHAQAVASLMQDDKRYDSNLAKLLQSFVLTGK